MLTKNNQKVEAKALHKYVLICVGCLFLFLSSFPVAYWRVSNHKKFQGFPFKSLEWNAPQKAILPYPR